MRYDAFCCQRRTLPCRLRGNDVDARHLKDEDKSALRNLSTLASKPSHLIREPRRTDMASRVSTFIQIVSAWPHISVHPHQFEAQEFCFDKAEVGHVHLWGTVDIPFPRAIRDVLL